MSIFYGIFVVSHGLVRVFDLWTCNQTCFNAARALKPLNNGLKNVEAHKDAVQECDFCEARDFTAAGRYFAIFAIFDMDSLL